MTSVDKTSLSSVQLLWVLLLWQVSVVWPIIITRTPVSSMGPKPSSWRWTSLTDCWPSSVTSSTCLCHILPQTGEWDLLPLKTYWQYPPTFMPKAGSLIVFDLGRPWCAAVTALTGGQTLQCVLPVWDALTCSKVGGCSQIQDGSSRLRLGPLQDWDLFKIETSSKWKSL